ncbi:MAG: L,D-transpeptidase, partial [Elusimicrobia bacterium]|nr:L,D-transpeptidase [Elusimicrobiota bacterium]
ALKLPRAVDGKQAGGPGGGLLRELQAAGYAVVGGGTRFDGPYVAIAMPEGFMIATLCRLIPTLYARRELCLDRVASFNATNPHYVKTRTPQPNSILADELMVPLDLARTPRIFADYEESLAGYAQYLLIDIGKGYLALYERGRIARVFPISAGAPGKRTPLMDFRIDFKEKDHFSGRYDGAWMPWSLHLSGPYFIHGGVLPGQSDSHGCVRMLIPDAEALFRLVKVGTPGRIISTPAP